VPVILYCSVIVLLYRLVGWPITHSKMVERADLGKIEKIYMEKNGCRLLRNR